MFFRNSLVLLWTFQVFLKLGSSNESPNLTVGEHCFVDHQNGSCKSIFECDEPCKDDLTPKWLYCESLPDTVCCPIPSTGRISEKKCLEYKEKACDVTTDYNLNVKRKSGNCTLNSGHLIAGGVEASRYEFPHMAMIGFSCKNEILWECAGTLVSDQFVLTAAHCVINKEKGNATDVRLGEHEKDPISGISYKVTKWIQHPNYTNTKHYYDIGLLKLNEKVLLTTNIRPACLPQENITTLKAIATGWGDVEVQQPSNILRKSVLDIFPQEYCREVYEEVHRNPAGGLKEILDEGILYFQVCAGSHQFKNNVCRGDSGAPLQIYHRTQFCSYEVIGIASFGDGCPGNDGSSSVYTRVFPFLKWIEEHVWPNE